MYTIQIKLVLLNIILILFKNFTYHILNFRKPNIRPFKVLKYILDLEGIISIPIIDLTI